jgi:hypothetical protein
MNRMSIRISKSNRSFSRVNNEIKCPNCQSSIEITEVMSAQLSSQIRADVENEVAAKRLEIAKLTDQVNQREAELESRSSQIEREVAQRMKEERERVFVEAQQAAEESLHEQLASREQELGQLRERLKESQRAELELQKKQLDLQDRAEALELEVAREVNEQRSEIRKKALEDADEQHRFNMAEKDSQIHGLLKKIDELKRKAEQGSQQTQGEVQEIALEDLLQSSFPTDSIEPVAKGTRGADTLQGVFDGTGLCCGQILWESKRTKNWSNGWLAKARDDQRSTRAACVVMVSEALPEGVRTFALIHGVWVCNWSCVVGLAAALRNGLIEVGKCKLAVQGRHDRMELVYNYLSGSEFQQRVEGVVEAFVTMQTDLESEKRSMNRVWSKREKQIQRAVINMAGMYGDLQGIIGSSMPAIEGLAVPRIEHKGKDSDGAHETARISA